MARNRVLSFVSQFSAAGRDHNSRTPTPTSNSPPRSNGTTPFPPLQTSLGHSHETTNSVFSPTPSSPTRPDFTASPVAASLNGDSPPDSSPRTGRQRANSRPLSMVQTYTPPIMDVNEDTIPELQPIFTFLNNHSNKLYQEGYFLKLDDQNSQGRPNPDRTWTECFAQLVGTVLSLWDAAELDAAGEHGEVLPKFINLTDASIKMIESLPTRSNDEQPLQNILSISTAGRNRYLLHFNSHHSLIQWTAGIRLAMFEHTTLQEAYTGALIAGKGKTLNNIGVVMERSRLKTEDWVRVRFGAGVPWRRCWCVITPPDEKEYQKQQKELKKRSPYDRSPVPVLKGDIKFYDTRKDGKKQKKAKPIASISEAYAAYAIYPQAKSLIDASTLLKIEGNITIHSEPPSSTEGFVFIMPESHPAVSGFEMLLRYLFPTWDTFGLYGRPGRLIASVLDQRSLMFGMPKHKKYGYLEILDVTSLILSDGSGSWSEKEWRRRLKELTAARMTAMDEDFKANGHSRSASRRSARLSIGPGSSVGQTRPRVNFADESDTRRTSRSMTVSERPSHRNDSAPPAAERQRVPSPPTNKGHSRNGSDTRLETQFDRQMPFRHTPGFDSPASAASPSPMNGGTQTRGFVNDLASTPERLSSEDELPSNPPPRDFGNMERMQTPEPVQPPPAFSHAPSSRPAGKPYHSPELRRANSRLSSTTLAQLANAGGVKPESYKDEFGRTSSESSSGSRPVQGDPRSQAVHAHVNSLGITANSNGSREAINQSSDRSTPTPSGQPSGPATPRDPGSQLHKSPLNQAMLPPSGQEMESHSSHPQYESRTGSTPSSGPVHRKPLPQRAHDALAQVTRRDTQLSETSNYDDEGSVDGSHDYASTTSAESIKSVERPRMGVLKTVGAEHNAQLTNVEKSYDIPQIDFGPTINYAATSTPRSKTPTPLSNNEVYGSRARSPNTSLSPSPGQGHHRQGSSDTLRKMAWQPSAIAGSSDRPGTLTPEQYVQQKAAAASAKPLYAHSRSPSSNTINAMRNNTPTPPLAKRRSSYDMLRPREGHSRSSSADLLRPGSQGALTALGYGSGDVPTRMPAREQENLARGSGGHPVSMATNKGSMQSGGLVGVIQAREREKAEMKQGVSSALAYEAMNRQDREMRQQHQQQLQYTSQASYGAPSQPGFAGAGLHWGGPASIPRVLYKAHQPPIITLEASRDLGHVKVKRRGSHQEATQRLPLEDTPREAGQKPWATWDVVLRLIEHLDPTAVDGATRFPASVVGMRRLPCHPSSLCSSLPIYTPRRANPATRLPRYPLGPQSATCLWFSACGERRSSSDASPRTRRRRGSPLPFRFETGVALFAKRTPRPFPPPFLSPPSGSFSDPLSTHHRSRDRRSAYVNGELIRGRTNGDDAVFASDSFICANDGVGAWSTRPRGHSGLWARLILHFWAQAVDGAAGSSSSNDPSSTGDASAGGQPDPVAHLQKAFEQTQEATSPPNDWQGTTTVAGAQIFYRQPDGGSDGAEDGSSPPVPVLYVTNLGDSQIMVIRPSTREIVFKTTEQWHWFDCPRQLGTNSPDTPAKNAVLDVVEIQEGDIVIAMSDGVIDNLWPHEIVESVCNSVSKWESGAVPVDYSTCDDDGEESQEFDADGDRTGGANGGMQLVADELMEAARVIAVDPFAESPYMEHAIEEGLPSEGGKLDDISVVAALCRRTTTK
ncbi:hypothetical protein PpBr36_00427 [Pyricularia pennisetigena]|uniref:hypothetical protein n=1 Tax=Pyricularia pennisetigena TaxID=1578925 RepID=UPI001151B745|nr:hypothetical protein PpBr36_00427 [Pyricularia pennisetigena]TLS28442.1 hypothetical protein PpBr36_00427 [Pyricularia pennisetigena]